LEFLLLLLLQRDLTIPKARIGGVGILDGGTEFALLLRVEQGRFIDLLQVML